MGELNNNIRLKNDLEKNNGRDLLLWLRTAKERIESLESQVSSLQTRINTLSTTTPTVTEGSDLVHIRTNFIESQTTWKESFPTGYKHFRIYINGLIPSTNNTRVSMQVLINGVAQSGASDYSFGIDGLTAAGAASSFNASTSAITLNSDLNISNTEAEGGFGSIIEILDPFNISQRKEFFFRSRVSRGGTAYALHNHDGCALYRGSNTPIDGLQFAISSGNIVKATFSLYGIKG